VSTSDRTFFRQFMMVLGILILFTIGMFFIARSIGNGLFQEMEKSPDHRITLRAAPVAEAAATKAETAPVAEAEPAAASAPSTTETAAKTETATASTADAGKPGDQIYNAVCVACHATGIAGAPKVGDAAAWKARADQGLDTLLKSALNGKGAMPPKGGNPAFSDADIHNAVLYMLKKTGLSAN